MGNEHNSIENKKNENESDIKNLPRYKQIKNLISFIDSFKNHLDHSYISNLVNLVLMHMISGNHDNISEINDAIKYWSEKQTLNSSLEKTQTLLSEEEYNSLDLIESTLAKIENATDTQAEEVLRQLYKKPPFFYVPNTKVSNILFDNTYDLTKPTLLTVGNTKKKEILVSAQIFLSVNDKQGIYVPQDITAYDRAVHDGVCSILACNNDMAATPRQIYEAMTGKSTRSQQALTHIVRSLNKMGNTTIKLDYSQQALAKGISCSRMIFEGKLLYFATLKMETNGQIVQGYKFFTMPILYEYALNVGQIITVDKSLLNIPNVANTDDSVVLRHYLLRRIQTMKNQRNCVNQNKIKFAHMFEYCQITGTDTQLNRKRRVVYDTLQAWVDMKYIKGYAEYRDGRKILGVEINL